MGGRGQPGDGNDSRKAGGTQGKGRGVCLEPGAQGPWEEPGTTEG